MFSILLVMCWRCGGGQGVEAVHMAKGVCTFYIDASLQGKPIQNMIYHNGGGLWIGDQVSKSASCKLLCCCEQHLVMPVPVDTSNLFAYVVWVDAELSYADEEDMVLHTCFVHLPEHLLLWHARSARDKHPGPVQGH